MHLDIHCEALHHTNTSVYDDYYRSGIIDGWEDRDKEYNFTHLFKITKKTGKSLKGTSILDLGCGTGDILPYLWEKKVGKYVGVDIYKPAIQIAKQKYPGETFIVLDILKDKTLKTFDYVFSSGALSIDLKSINNYDFLRAMVSKMWELSKYGIAFNVLTDEDIAPAKHLFYYSIKRVKNICKEIAPNAAIRIRRTPIDNGKDYDEEAQIHVYMFRKK